jgi:hypothetical protein
VIDAEFVLPAGDVDPSFFCIVIDERYSQWRRLSRR